MKNEILQSLQKNKFIPPETLEQFISKKTGNRPAIKLHFDNQPGPEERRELLQEYLRLTQEKKDNKNMSKAEEVRAQQEMLH
mmetsp:Transcript_25404/g.39195  ORF Transcript_25404/g.39195 Transcript_25404/m.39195 type:complete len:82 (+) Transcript_25404:496-741(+)